MSKSYNVIIPVAGHIVVNIEATTQEEAIRLAFESEVIDEGINVKVTGDVLSFDYELLQKFHSGNVCHCPIPWQVYVEEQ